MKFVHEFRDAKLVRGLLESLEKLAQKPMTVMEICGGQTHSIVKYGIDRLIPESISLVHGPGCPVCIIPEDMIDTAIRIAKQPGVLFCSYGDMLRVPGSQGSLLHAKAEGANIRVLYSPQELLTFAQKNPQNEVVFFAIGFETTAPAHALVLKTAKQLGIQNLSCLVAHVLVPPAMRFILSQQGCCIQAFLAAGHVCTVTGYGAYHELSRQYAVPIVVTGFEPADILEGLLICAKLVQTEQAVVVNQYTRSVREEGNSHALSIVSEVFEVHDAHWRGIGLIPQSGLRLAGAYRLFDAGYRFGISLGMQPSPSLCEAGRVLLGQIKPKDCPYFGSHCNPDHPLGAPMVSSEGACAAYFHLRHHSLEDTP